MAYSSWPNLLADPYRNVLWKFGEAIIVAQLIALVVDTAAKQKLLEEFAEDVSTHIIGRRLPPQRRRMCNQRA